MTDIGKVVRAPDIYQLVSIPMMAVVGNWCGGAYSSQKAMVYHTLVSMEFGEPGAVRNSHCQ